MMIKKNVVSILLILLLISCDKTEVIELNLKGSIKGTITTADEFGWVSHDYANAKISLHGIDPVISAYSDNLGNYTITDIPTGTYNVIVSKNGYGEFQSQNRQIVGGEEPIFINLPLYKKSSLIIDNLSIELVDEYKINLKGIVNHNFSTEELGFKLLAIKYYMHSNSNPSFNNYLNTGLITFNTESGNEFNRSMYIDKNLFPTGSKIYVVAYGINMIDGGYYDYSQNKHIYNSLGESSNTTSITVP